jgi:hypothetical protein
MQNRKSLILLGSTGFLGTTVLNLLKSEPLADLDIMVSKNTGPNETIFLNLLDIDFRLGRKLNIVNLSKDLNPDLLIINCASSRNSNNEEMSMQGNFTFPKQVLESLLGINGLQIRWIQMETFWQYSSSLSNDKSYVFWKNQFGHLLSTNSTKENFMLHKVVLPHLIGPYDDTLRFLPKIFLKILKGEGLQITSPDEVFCIADVRNVAQYLVSNISGKSQGQDLTSALFPFTEIQLGTIIRRFMKISDSKSQIEFLDNLGKSNPILNLSEQPPLLNLIQKSPYSIDTTFSDIASWLSELQSIDSL